LAGCAGALVRHAKVCATEKWSVPYSKINSAHDTRVSQTPTCHQMQSFNSSLVWFRRDLRSFDHAALHAALTRSKKVYCVFVFDQEILSMLPRADRRVEFIHASVVELNRSLREMGGGLIVRHAWAKDEIPKLAAELLVDAVFVNRDYEPQAVQRDAEIGEKLKSVGKILLNFKDQVVFEKDEVLSLSGTPYSIFTPYKNAWLRKLDADAGSHLQPYTVDQHAHRLAQYSVDYLPSLTDIGFETTDLNQLNTPTGMSGGETLCDDFVQRIAQYDLTRNYPSVYGTSHLSVHLRFGTVSIRSLVRRACEMERSGEGRGGATAWLNELIWRDFYFMILHHHPDVVTHAFKPAYDRIEWHQGAAARELFGAWCEARTGYPLVDAAMLQLNQTGYMHNRLRMVTASFLIKDLGIDWRWGERYFAEKLIDFDLAANNGGWQWAASSGCDAQPYTRIFNPVTQSERFDQSGKFIRHYLPQLARLSDIDIHAPWRLDKTELKLAGIDLGRTYPVPIVEHATARATTLARYAVTKSTVR
jgi:deoxyribodipyrimidine photo-lyase